MKQAFILKPRIPGFSTICVSRWIKKGSFAVTTLRDPFADANGTNLIPYARNEEMKLEKG